MLFFVFICKVDSFIAESEVRKIIFKCLKNSKIAKRLDISDRFWEQFEMYNDNTKKVMGLYEIENVDNQNICTIPINQKENFEKLKNRKMNKKHKGVRKDTAGMFFESYANRISKLRNLDCKEKEKKIVQRGYK